MMVSSEDAPKLSVYRKVSIVLPKTFSARLVALGVVLFDIAGIVPTRFDVVPVLILLAAFISAFSVTILSSLREKGHRVARVFRTLLVTAAIALALLALLLFSRFLAFISVGGGILFFASSSPEVSAAAYGLLLVLAVLLLWIPDVFFRIQLDMAGTGNAQRVLLGLITAASCTATGICILLDHFGNGVLRNVNLGPLIVGIFGTVLLVAHPYRSLARACWQRGVVGILSFSAHKQQWDGMLTQLQKAIDRAAALDMTPSRR